MLFWFPSEAQSFHITLTAISNHCIHNSLHLFSEKHPQRTMLSAPFLTVLFFCWTVWFLQKICFVILGIQFHFGFIASYQNCPKHKYKTFGLPLESKSIRKMSRIKAEPKNSTPGHSSHSREKQWTLNTVHQVHTKRLFRLGKGAWTSTGNVLQSHCAVRAKAELMVGDRGLRWLPAKRQGRSEVERTKNRRSRVLESLAWEWKNNLYLPTYLPTYLLNLLIHFLELLKRVPVGAYVSKCHLCIKKK